tara:strand:+ start:2827 stop:3690 length:864 start_codon:yes stop_codon:yes gene_type:complete
MSLSADQIARHPQLIPALRQQARTLVGLYESNPRLATVFATQQRWLMAHIALALFYRSDSDPQHRSLTISRFVEQVQAHGVASRNTADAFSKEMLQYQFIRYLPSGSDGRVRPVEMMRTSLESVSGWVALHLATLDAVDGGQRMASFVAHTDMLDRIEPLIADGLLARQSIREPSGTFSLFAWLDKGGIVMERIISGIADAEEGVEQISTEVVSVTDMAEWLNLSRTHLVRKLREAEALGSIGWSGKRRQSAMWVSRGFLNEIASAQAVKLAVIDAAFEQIFSLQLR